MASAHFAISDFITDFRFQSDQCLHDDPFHHDYDHHDSYHDHHHDHNFHFHDHDFHCLDHNFHCHDHNLYWQDHHDHDNNDHQHIVETQQQEHVFSERNIMSETRHQFITR